MTEIRTDVPIPPLYGKGLVPALRGLANVGDSVWLKTKVSSVGTVARRAGLTGRYTARVEGDGVRVWLIKLAVDSGI